MIKLEQQSFNIKDLSSYPGIPEKTLYNWPSHRTISSIKIGGRILFDLNAVDKTMTSNKRDMDIQNTQIIFKYIKKSQNHAKKIREYKRSLGLHEHTHPHSL